jgi:hypothetical protein
MKSCFFAHLIQKWLFGMEEALKIKAIRSWLADNNLHGPNDAGFPHLWWSTLKLG